MRDAAWVLAAVLSCAQPAWSLKTLRVCDDIEEPASLDPYQVFSEKAHTLLQQVLEGLVRFGPDGQLEPALAERWERVDDTTVRFHLRPGVRFHDGEPLDARSVKSSIEKYLDPATRFPGAGFVETIAGVGIVDSRTVDIRTRSPDGLLLNRLAAWIHIVPARAGTAASSRHPVGTGPFKFKSWEPGRRIILEANRDYWMKGFPRVDRLEFIFLPLDRQLPALMEGEADLLTSLPGTQTLSIRSHSETQLLKRPTFYTIGSSMRTNEGSLSDVRVRRAMNHALDKKDLVRYDVLGNGIPLAALSFPGQFGHNPALKPYEYDPERARRLLTQAGYPRGFTLKTFLKANAERTGRMMAVQLKKVGIILDITVVPDARLMEAFDRQAWDLTIGDVPDPMNHSFFIQAILLYSKSPYSLMKDPDYDRRLEEMSRTLDLGPQERLARDIDVYVHENAFGLFTYQRIRTYAMRRGLIFTPFVSGMPFFYGARWKEGRPL